MDYSLLGSRIRNCRKSRGMSQAKLAEMLDVSVNYIGQIELAERHIGLDLLENISIVLDISIIRSLIWAQPFSKTSNLKSQTILSVHQSKIFLETSTINN